MGTHSRQRHVSKQRSRARHERARTQRHRFVRPTAEPAGPDGVSILRSVLLHWGSPVPLAEFGGLPEVEQQRAVALLYAEIVGLLVARGWTPLDLSETGRRRASDVATTYLLDVLAAHTQRYPASRVHPRWRAELDSLGARPAPPLSAWCASRARTAWPDVVGTLLALLAVLRFLPPLPSVMSAPGLAVTLETDTSGVNDAVLRRVRGLLAKAESTQFEHEADALSAKAQTLMTRHSIDLAMATAPADAQPAPALRRMWLDVPYVGAKASLVAAVARANRSRCVSSEDVGFVTVIGFAADLDTVELLSTSLLLQATRGMRGAGPQRNRYGTSSTRSFRRSFLLAFGIRIGERLREAAEETVAQADAGRSGALLPVLASRERQVQESVEEVFPDLIHKRVRVSDAAGWGAGRAAADLADLHVHTPLDQ